MDKGVDANFKRSRLAHNNTVKIVSMIQKVLNTGRAHVVEMRTVGRYIVYSLNSIVEECIKSIDNMNNVKSKGKSKISKGKDMYSYAMINVKDELEDILKELSKSIPKTYESTILPNGYVDKTVFEELVKIDNEITSNLKLLSVYLADTSVDSDRIDEINSMLKEIRMHITERINICKKLD